MKMLSGFFRSFLTSLIVTMLMALVMVSLFVGDFPPKVSQIKKVFHQYQKMIKVSQNVMDQFGDQDPSVIADELQKARLQQVQLLGQARGDQSRTPSREEQIEAAMEDRAVPAKAPVVQAQVKSHIELPNPSAQVVEVKAAELPDEIKRQMYELQKEIFRLQQRVYELEKSRQPAAAANQRR